MQQSKGVVPIEIVNLIRDFEIQSENRYNTSFKYPTWPGGESGITIGIGYDLGFASVGKFKNDWAQYLSKGNIQMLTKVVGVKGLEAKSLLNNVKSIEVPLKAANSVFQNKTIPEYAQLTKNAFPGCTSLNPTTFGILVSIVYNRGASMTGPNRVEMLNIQKAIKKQIKVDNIYLYIAEQIRSMKRLWVGKGLDGLLKRRQLQAKYVESCA